MARTVGCEMPRLIPMTNLTRPPSMPVLTPEVPLPNENLFPTPEGSPSHIEPESEHKNPEDSILVLINNQARSISSTPEPEPPMKSKAKRKRSKPLLQCPICPLQFKTNAPFRNHLEIHEGKRPFVCPLCGWGGSSEFDLLEHTGIKHTNEAHFPCEMPNCNKRYKTVKGLREHKVLKHYECHSPVV